jgi:hypothetical protein
MTAPYLIVLGRAGCAEDTLESASVNFARQNGLGREFVTGIWESLMMRGYVPCASAIALQKGD